MNQLLQGCGDPEENENEKGKNETLVDWMITLHDINKLTSSIYL